MATAKDYAANLASASARRTARPSTSTRRKKPVVNTQTKATRTKAVPRHQDYEKNLRESQSREAYAERNRQALQHVIRGLSNPWVDDPSHDKYKLPEGYSKKGKSAQQIEDDKIKYPGYKSTTAAERLYLSDERNRPGFNPERAAAHLPAQFVNNPDAAKTVEERNILRIEHQQENSRKGIRNKYKQGTPEWEEFDKYIGELAKEHKDKALEAAKRVAASGGDPFERSQYGQDEVLQRALGLIEEDLKGKPKTYVLDEDRVKAEKRARERVTKFINENRTAGGLGEVDENGKAKQAKQSVLGKVLGSPAGKVLGGALTALDTPRAAVMGLYDELADQEGGVLNVPLAFMNGDLPKGFSPRDVVEKTFDPKKRVMGGDVLEEHFGVKGDDNFSKATRTFGGFGADVVADPLTYVGGVGLASKGIKEVGERAAQRGAEMAAEEGLDDVARAALRKETADVVARARRTGIADLTNDELERYFPEKYKGLLASSGAPGRAAQRGIAHGKAKVADWIASHATFLQKDADVLKAARSGDPERAYSAVMTKLVKDTAGREAKSIAQTAFKKFETVTKDFTDQDWKNLAPALEGDEAALVALGGRHTGVREVLDGLHAAARDAGIEINNIGDYFPRVLARDPATQEAMAKLGIDVATGDSKKLRAVFEQGRKLKPGDNTFMGVKFHARNNADITKKISDIFREKVADIDPNLADELAGWFSPDPKESLARYTRGVSNRIAQNNASQKLFDAGIGTDITHELLTRFASKKARQEAGRLTRQMTSHADARDYLADRLAMQSDELAQMIGGGSGDALANPNLYGNLDSALGAVERQQTNLDNVSAEVRQQVADADAAVKRSASYGKGLQTKATNLQARAVEIAQQQSRLNEMFGADAAESKLGKKLAAEAEKNRLDIASVAKAQENWMERRAGTFRDQLAQSDRIDSAWDAVSKAQEQYEDVRAMVAESAQDTAARISDLEQQLQTTLETVGSRRLSPTEQGLFDDWREAVEEQIDRGQKLLGEEDPTLRQVLAMESSAANVRAQIAQHGKGLATAEVQYAALPRKTVERIETAFGDSLRNYKEIKQGIGTPKEVADWLLEVEQINWPKFMKVPDKIVNWMKAWQIATPGFHTRNMLGGMFNNALAGVDPASYLRLFKAIRAEARGAETEDVLRLRQLRMAVGKGQIGDAAKDFSTNTPLRARDFLSLSTKNPWVRANRAGGENVEFLLRGALGWDVLEKGGTIDDVVSGINRYHFDYDDLSTFEQGVKHVIPFYTWTRKNVPLQLEMMGKNPKWFARYEQLRNEIEANSEGDDFVPDWFADELSIRTPLTKGGGHIYSMPDLPLQDLTTALGPMKALNPGLTASQRLSAAVEDPLTMVSPLYKTPIELKTGTQFFKDLPLRDDEAHSNIPVPLPAFAVKGLAPALKFAGLAHVNEDGDLVMTEKDAYALEQYVPLIARYRRLMPNDEKYEAKRMSSVLSFLGFRVRTNTTEEQDTARYYQEQEAGR